jgi:polar amino acid transport system substrate-binding protein
MRKILLVLTVIITLFLGGCIKKEDDLNSLEKVQNQGYLTLGLDDTFAPMGFRDEAGDVVGFDIDLAKAVALELGVELRIQPIEWDSKTLELNAGNIDMIWNGLSITPSREESILFSTPYLSNNQIVLVREGFELDDLNDLEGLKVGVQIDSSGQSALQDSDVYNLVAEMIQFDTFVEAVMDLTVGRIDAIVVDEINARYVVELNQYAVEVTEVSLGTEQYGIGFRIDDVELRNGIDNALDTLVEKGTTSVISEYWFGEDIFRK